MRRTKADAEKTRKAILDAAAAIFSQKGYERTTLQEIAEAIKATRGAVYWHFKNKVEIFDAIHEQLYRPILELILEDVDREEPDPLKQLEALVVKLFEDLSENIEKRRALKLFFIHCDYSGELEPYRAIHAERKAQSRKLFERFLQSAMAKGQLRADLDLNLLSQALGCFMKGVVMEYLINPEYFSITDEGPRLMKIFFNGIRA